MPLRSPGTLSRSKMSRWHRNSFSIWPVYSVIGGTDTPLDPAGDDLIQIVGTNFGPPTNVGERVVFIGDAACKSTTYLVDSGRLQCLTPAVPPAGSNGAPLPVKVHLFTVVVTAVCIDSDSITFCTGRGSRSS